MKTREFIRTTRNLLGMTFEEFSYQIGYSTRSVYRWESGSAEPGGTAILEIMRLCKERGIKLDDLVFFYFATVGIVKNPTLF